jgi:hypothetical protein
MTDLMSSAISALTGILVLLAVTLWLLHRLSRRHVAVANRPDLWQGRDYRCPACTTPMNQGWVMLGKGAIWSPRGKGAPGTFAHIGQALDNTLSLAMRPAANMAWHCPHCRLLLIDHDKLVKP